ncbi:MAG TPA: hypothetical protein VKJ77_23565 [Caballeronia sp.]|nr:hypothetical protein [Caballeronia sp.]
MRSPRNGKRLQRKLQVGPGARCPWGVRAFSDTFHHSKWRPAATAASIRRASAFADLYYPFSGNPLVTPSVAIPWGGALIDNLDNLFNKDY